MGTEVEADTVVAVVMQVVVSTAEGEAISAAEAGSAGARSTWVVVGSGGGAVHLGGGGVRNFSGGARTFSAPRVQSFGGARAGIGSMAGRVGARPGINASNLRSFGNAGMNRGLTLGNRPALNVGNFRSFGNTGITGISRAGGAGVTRINTTVGNRVNTLRYSSAYGSGSGYRGYGYGWRNPYYGYHRGWLNGYWGGYYPYGYGYGLGWGYPYWGLGYGGYGYGYGLGWGLSNWLYGSSLYGYGYSNYNNPYYYPPTNGIGVYYDYSQPLNLLGAAPADTIADEALALFSGAHDAFKQGDYPIALQQAEAALAKTPNDSALHEFRALCLFALGRYDEAAQPLYAVLSVGPGWDWQTLISLYPNVDVYTTHLRTLEAYCNAHLDAASGRFVLAYQYMTEGYTGPAVTTLKQVVALKPGDTLSRQLLQSIEAVERNKLNAVPGAAGGPAPLPVEAATIDTKVPDGATVAGTWTAQPNPETSIVLTIEPGGPFTWKVSNKGVAQQFSGTSTFGAGVLTLAQDKGPVLVGRVSWKDLTHMTFRVISGGPDDPGLNFSK